MRVLFFNQYYPPDTAATAQRLADLCEGLSGQHDVTVICGRPSYDPIAGEGRRAGGAVRVIRVPSTSFHRRSMLGRVSNYLSFLVLAFFRSLREGSRHVVVAMTDPPIVGLVAWGLARIRRVPFVYIIQDLYPDVAVALGKIKSRWFVRVLDRLTLLLLRRSDRVIAISASMCDRLVEKGTSREKIRVISNWADTDTLVPGPKANPFSARYALADRFVVMYSGNVGLSQDLDVLMQAAKRLEGMADVRVVIVGDGAGKARLLRAAQEGHARNVVFLPRQPIAEMRHSFASADVFVVPLAAGLDGLVVPSKVFAVMASGRPFIAAIDETSEVAEIVRRWSCGLLVKPGSAKELADAIEWAYRNRGRLSVMGTRGREAVESEYSRDRAIARYAEVFAEVC